MLPFLVVLLSYCSLSTAESCQGIQIDSIDEFVEQTWPDSMQLPRAFQILLPFSQENTEGLQINTSAINILQEIAAMTIYIYMFVCV